MASSELYLRRYAIGRKSALSLLKRNKSSTVFAKIAYHVTKTPTLEPMKPKLDDYDKSDEPIDDLNVPRVLYTAPLTRNKHHKDASLPKLASLPGTITSSDMDLLNKKIEQCKTMLLFTDPEADLRAKEVKINALREINTVFTSTSNIAKISKECLDNFFDMLSINLFRSIPAVPKKYLFPSDEPNMVDVEWTHLSICYSMLSSYAAAQPNDFRFSRDFLNSLVKNFQAPDWNEREQILQFFLQYLDKNHDQIDWITDESSYLIISYFSGRGEPFCVSPILKLYAQNPPTNPKILTDTLLPLLTAHHLSTFFTVLQDVYKALITPDNLPLFINASLKYWPESNASKQILFLKMLTFLVERLTSDNFEELAPKIFKTIISCCNSVSHKVVEASFQVWSNVKVIPLLLDHARTIFPISVPPIQRVMKEHWNHSTQDKALATLKSMHDIDPFIFDELTKKAPPAAAPQMQEQKNWALIARQAAKADQDVNLAKILSEIQIRFTQAQKKDEPKPKVVTPGNGKNTSSNRRSGKI